MTKKDILILGNGFIGRRIQGFLDCSASSERISAYKDVESILNKHRPKVIINAIGYTGNRNVDDCEKNIDKTVHSNTFVPLWLGEAAYRHGIKLVHISSGCIYHFDYTKQKPISEGILPDYYDLYYSRTKIYAETILCGLEKRCNILILRIRIPLDDRSHPKNILTKLLSFHSTIDIPNSVTYVPDFLKALNHLIKIDARGVYNIALSGPLRYPQLLDEFKRQEPGFQYKIMALKDFKLVRTNLILSTRKLEESGFHVRKPEQILKECVKNYLQC